MKISQKPLDDHQIHLTVEVESQTLEAARHKAARKIAQRVKIPGFRPGKAPFSVVEKQVGATAIKDEALDIVLDDVYPKLIEETGIKPYGPGTLEKVTEDQEPHIYEFRVPLSPDVKLGDYTSIRLPFEEKPVADADIENVLNNLREQNALLQPVQRPAQEGDIAYILLSAERQKPKDGKTTLLTERRTPVVIEKEDVDTKNEWPFPGFSRLLIGLSVSEEKAIPYNYPEDSEVEDLRGEAADFKLKVEEIKDRRLPEVDDAFAQSLGSYKDLTELRTEVKRQLNENFERQQNDEYENQIVKKIIDGSEIRYPPQMLEHEMHHFIEDMEPDLAARGLDMETYLKSRQMTHEQLEEEVKPTVEERLKKSLVIMEVSKQEKIEIAEGEAQSLVDAKVKRLQELLNEQDFRKVLSKENLQGFVSRTVTEEVIKQTLARLHAIAMGKNIEKEATMESQKESEIKNEEQAS